MNEGRKKTQAAYNAKCKIFTMRVNKETEDDILKWLSRPGASTKRKEMIRKDLKKNPVT